MLNLLRKYYYLNRKNLMFGFLAALFFSLIAFDSNKYYPVALLMIPSLLFSFIVGRMCYEEDAEDSKEFLLALPIHKSDLMLEKNIVGHICIVVGVALTHAMFFLINSIKNESMVFDIRIIAMIICFLLLYNFIYIYLNYRYDYSKTQFSSYIILGLMLLLFRYGNRIIELVGNTNRVLLIASVVILSGLSLLLSCQLGGKILES